MDEFSDFSSSPDAYTANSALSSDSGIQPVHPTSVQSDSLAAVNNIEEEQPALGRSANATETGLATNDGMTTPSLAEGALSTNKPVDDDYNDAEFQQFTSSLAAGGGGGDDFGGFTVANTNFHSGNNGDKDYDDFNWSKSDPIRIASNVNADEWATSDDFDGFTSADTAKPLTTADFDHQQQAMSVTTTAFDGEPPLPPAPEILVEDYRQYLQLLEFDDLTSGSSIDQTEAIGHLLQTKLLSSVYSELSINALASLDVQDNSLQSLYADINTESSEQSKGGPTAAFKSPRFPIPTANSVFQNDQWCKTLRRIQFDLKDPDRLLNRYRWRRSAIRKRALIAMGIPINLDEALVDSNPQLPDRQRQASAADAGTIASFSAADKLNCSAIGNRSFSFEEEEILDKAFGQSGPPTPEVQKHVKPLTNDLAVLGNVLTQSSAPYWDQEKVDQMMKLSPASLVDHGEQLLRSIRAQLRELVKQGDDICNYYRAHSRRIQKENAGYNREIEELVQKAQIARSATSQQKQSSSSLRPFSWGRKH